MSKCIICNNPNLKIFKFKHTILKDCQKVVCESCKHFSYESNMTDIAPTVLDFVGITSTEFDCKTDGQSVLE